VKNISTHFIIDDKITEIQDVKAEISKNKDKSMHDKYMAIYHHLQGKLNAEIADMFNLCEHTVGTYIKKYKTQGLNALIPDPKSESCVTFCTMQIPGTREVLIHLRKCLLL